LPQGETFAAHDYIAQAFVGHASFIGRFGCRSEPALVNPPTIRPVGVGVVRVQLESQAGLEEGARDPIGCETKLAAGPPDFRLRLGLRIAFNRSE